MQNYIVPDPIPGAPMAEYPELILGRRLPAGSIKWTKDVRLLYGRTAPRQRRRDSTDGLNAVQRGTE